jgi:hypothetical protein
MCLETLPLALRNFDRPSRHFITNTINQKSIAVNSDLYMHTSECRTVALQPAIINHYKNITSSNVCSFHIQRQSSSGREITCIICWGLVLELTL